MNFAVIGCGLIGQKRLRAIQSFGSQHRVVFTADSALDRAQELARLQPGACATTDWQAVLAEKNVDTVIVATTNNWLAPITLAAVSAGKNVLVEKPAGRSPQEIDPLVEAAAKRNVYVHAGFNHRYHPAFIKAVELFKSGALGPMMFIRARYGHGGRLGYEKEWRADSNIAGGGELLDQGVHLIDLARQFLGDFTTVKGVTTTSYWDMNVEDNGFMMLQTDVGQVAWLHASATEWKNLFSFEIYGQHAKLHIEGLGGSYGVERLYYYKMLPKMGPPETTIWEYPGEDTSWRDELDAFVRSIQEKRAPDTTLRDARAALTIVSKIYAQNKMPGAINS